MSNPRNDNSIDNQDERRVNDVFDDESLISSSLETPTIESGRPSRERSEIGLTDRLTETLVDNGDVDLLIQRSDREDRLLQWIQALDVQVMGACRADERLKPFLKMNVSGGVADDGLLAHLSQHFEPVEVGILARCFCVPLVSIRVGKINKQGTLLCPTATRGNLNLTLLPTSDLRLSFNGDDGNIERLITLRSNTHCSAVVVDEISADTSGRSFFVKVSDAKVFYFWCSEKSKLLGNELLAKMKDIIKKKPSIAELTGISKSRLDCFATQLRVYLVENSIQETSAYSLGSSSSYPEGCDVSITSAKSSPFQGILTTEALSQQGGSSPTSSSFEGAEEKHEQHEDSYPSAFDTSVVTLPYKANTSGFVESARLVEVKSCPISPSGFLESLEKLASPPACCQSLQTPAFKPTPFTPYYCWCPQAASTSEYPVAASQEQIPASLVESPLLPPLSTLLSSSRSSSPSTLPPLAFPTLLPDPIVRLPLPSSQQVLTFTPLMCDPIVHIPVIDVCSSGQGYLVSAGPGIRGTIPPLHPKVVVNPLIPETDPVVEKGARETLQLLISGLSQGSAQFTDVFPSVLTSVEGKPNIAATGSRGLYCGSTEIYVTTNNTPMFSFSGSSSAEKDGEMHYGEGCAGDLQDQPGDTGLSSDDGAIN